jgi:hypothetical protein
LHPCYVVSYEKGSTGNRSVAGRHDTADINTLAIIPLRYGRAFSMLPLHRDCEFFHVWHSLIDAWNTGEHYAPLP